MYKVIIKAPGSTSTPSILQANLLPFHNLMRVVPFFWKLSHAISGVCPEDECPSVDVIWKAEEVAYLLQSNVECKAIKYLMLKAFQSRYTP